MSEATNQIRTEIRKRFVTEIKERFVKVALEPQVKQRHPIGPASAKGLGYDVAEVHALPAQVTESFCGVGNPLALGELHVGEALLDLGSGAGLDSSIAARTVGPTG